MQSTMQNHLVVQPLFSTPYKSKFPATFKSAFHMSLCWILLNITVFLLMPAPELLGILFDSPIIPGFENIDSSL